MAELGRGWDHGERFRPARDVEIRYGHGLLKSESEKWPPYLAVTGRTAWEHARKYVSRKPAGVGVVRMLDWGHLEEVTTNLREKAELVVGLGGGTALDASKYVALRRELPLRLVPTAVSTGAIIHGVFARWKGHSIQGPVQEWPYCDFEHVLVDYDLVLEAPPYLNTAGIGDILCMYSGVEEWRYAAERGLAPAVDQPQTKSAVDYFESLVDGFPKTLGAGDSLTPASIRFIMTAIQDRDDRQLRSPHAPGAGHSMTGPIEEAAQRGLVHGEMAALGAVIVCWATGRPDPLVDWMRRCLVRFRPADIGLERLELQRALELAPDFMRARNMDTVLAREPVTGQRFRRLWEFLERA